MKLNLKNNPEFKERVLLCALALLWNEVVYIGGRWIARGFYHYDLTLSIDTLVPFLPWTVTIYFGCYLFWAVNYYLCAKQRPEDRYRFFSADILAKGICLLFFILLPTTNVRPEITGDGLWAMGMKLLYSIDDADNLFPSIHCLVSWLCWVGVRTDKSVPLVYRWISFVLAVAVCVTTLSTRQHVMVDVISGVLLAEVCYCITGIKKVYGIYGAFVSWINRKLFKTE